MRKCSVMLRAFKIIILALSLATSMSGCADTINWKEEVKLLDGRVIVVDQQRKYEGAYNGSNYGGVERESWLTLTLPETDNQSTTWHEKLTPSNLNVVNDKLFIVGKPPTAREFYLYDKPRPPYVGYVYENKAWKRISFDEIPVEMYDMNLSIVSEEYIQSGRITLDNQAISIKNPRVSKNNKRINPSHRSKNDQN